MERDRETQQRETEEGMEIPETNRNL